MKNIIIITGGAGFVGSNLIEKLLKNTKYKIISIDNYSTGSKKNHIKNKNIKYLKSDTSQIFKALNPYKKKIHSVFHFGEFSRIYQSFLKMERCIESNTIGSNAVFNFCLSNKIKLIYSATSASIGNKGKDKNLSPYAFTKAKNLELLENLKNWFNFKYEIIYFYNVYGPRQITKGKSQNLTSTTTRSPENPPSVEQQSTWQWRSGCRTKTTLQSRNICSGSTRFKAWFHELQKHWLLKSHCIIRSMVLVRMPAVVTGSCL